VDDNDVDEQDDYFAPAIQVLEGPSCQLMSCVPSAGSNSSQSSGCTTVSWHSIDKRRYHILVFGQTPSTFGNFAIRLAEVKGEDHNALLRPNVFSKSGAAIDVLVETDGGGSSLVAETPPIQSSAAIGHQHHWTSSLMCAIVTCFASMLVLYL
jgi:hypothetical protein